MKRKLIGFPLFTAALLAVAACVTINVYFPEKAIEDLSQQIEEEVQKKAAEIDEGEPAPQEEDEGSATESPGSSTGLFDSLLGIRPAYASDVPAPDVSNPAIRKIIDSRAARAGRLNEFKALGVIGENNQALVEIRALDQLQDLRLRSEVQKLVRAENEDRERLFKEIAAAENVDLAQLPRIRETYAATLRANAAPGDWIQTANGDWKQK
jgi:uncharacterized protein YdbL (DUF1318 family)